MFNKILIATDGSNPAERALKAAVDVARQYDAHLLVLHVRMHGKVPHGFRRMAQVEHIGSERDSTAGSLYNIPGNMMTVMGKIKAEVSEDDYFDVLANHIITDSMRMAKDAGIKQCDSRIVNGDAAEAILEASNNDEIDLVVVGARGIGAMKRMLTGSVATKVSQLSDCPCMIVK